MQPINQDGYTREYCEKLAQNFKNRENKEFLNIRLRDFCANPSAYATTPGASSPIPLQRRTIDNPDDNQIIFWSLREGIAQRLYPDLDLSVRSNFNPEMLAKIRQLYATSVARWNAKNNPN